jgi:hypothetical protein
MSNFSLLTGTRNIEKSMPFALYRFSICLGAGLGYLLATLSGAGIAIAADSWGKNPNSMAPLGAALGFAAFAFLMYKLRPYWLHHVRIPQLALLAEQALGRPIPVGKAQIEHAKQQVRDSFPSTADLSALDQQIQLALADIPAASRLFAPLLGHPQAGQHFRKLLGCLAALNHQTVLAGHFHSGHGNPWRTAAAGLAAHDRDFDALLKYRIYASAFEWLGFAAAFPLLAIGFQMLTSGFPVSFGYWIYLFAGVFSWALKAAFLEAIAEAALLGVFFPLAEQAADPAREAELAGRSAAYKAILDQAGRD